MKTQAQCMNGSREASRLYNAALRPLTLIAALVILVIPRTTAQSVPKELLSVPVRLELSNPTTEVKVGSKVTYTVTLKNARGQAVAALTEMPLEIVTPSGTRSISLPAGKSSTSFEWQAETTGVVQLSVRSGKLYPAAGLVLVTPSTQAGNVPRAGLRLRLPETEHLPVRAAARAADRRPAAQPAAPPPPPAPAEAPSLDTKIQLFVNPHPVYGDAFDHIWKASVTVAVVGNQDQLTPAPANLPIHLSASWGQLSTQDFTLAAGQYSNFQNPVDLTTDRSGKGDVEAISPLGHSGPIDVDYLQPPPTELHLSVGTPALAGTGSSSVSLQVCLLDGAGAITTADHDIQVTLSASGSLNSPEATIRQGNSCTDPVQWTSGAGAATVNAASAGLKSDFRSLIFPAFPWYFVWLAAIGGLSGALVWSRGVLLTKKWWSHTWRGLVLGAVLGAIFYLFARFGAIALPKDSPFNIQNIPVISNVGSFLLGFVGGALGRKRWKI